MSFFNLNLKLKLSHKLVLMASIYMISFMIFSSCQPQAPISEAKGDIKALVPLAGQDKESLSEVTLKKIENLKEVSGGYVRFYYTPGAGQTSLNGGSPQARYIRTKNGVYVPSDVMTQQMFAIYFHIQNLTDFNDEISSELKSTEPFQVGLNTKVAGNTAVGHNNAFYDGKTNALLIVPYSLNNIPISINAGIIAHEFFHSVFYKMLFKNFLSRQQVLSAQADASVKNTLLFNETYIRGLNEGFADYWGWVYTTNVDYIGISLPAYGEDRKMVLDPDQVGVIQTQIDIETKVSEAQSLAFSPSEFLTGYTYDIGTPHARFLKELTMRMSIDNNLDLNAAKLIVAKTVFKYLKDASIQTQAFSATDMLSADHFFQYIAQPEKSGLSLTPEQCEFVLKYLSTTSKVNIHASELCKDSNE